MPDEPLVQSTRFPSSPRGFVVSENINIKIMILFQKLTLNVESACDQIVNTVAEAYTTQPNSKASSRVLYNIFESTCGG